MFYRKLPHGLGLGAVFQFFFSYGHQAAPRVLGDQAWISTFRQGDSIINLVSAHQRAYNWARAAGTRCVIKYLGYSRDFYVLALPSGIKKQVPLTTLCTLGRNSNLLHKKEVLGGAGVVRRRGIRPSVRGVAMNPVDHPHGGRTKTSQPEVSPWGWVAKHSR